MHELFNIFTSTLNYCRKGKLEKPSLFVNVIESIHESSA